MGGSARLVLWIDGGSFRIHSKDDPKSEARLSEKIMVQVFERANSMTMRTSSKTVTFALPFLLKGIDRELAAGSYRVVTDEELIEQLSFPVYRRVSTMIFVPAQASSVEMVSIDPLDLQAAQDRDKVMRESDASSQGAR